MKHTTTVHEQVSALADGHLRDEEFAQVIDKVCSSEELRATWHAYHVVGDVLRSGVHSACSDSSQFLSRLQQRLAAEPSAPALAPDAAAMPVLRRAEAANEPVFRWKLVAGAASLAAAAAIGWNWVGGAGPQPAAQLAQQQQQQQQQVSGSVLAASGSSPQAAVVLAPMRVVVGNGNPQVMLRDPRLDQLLEAHQQAGGASQMPSGFLRNATFDGPAR
ncbi:anti-sigma factor [Variovorax sp. WS11]|uniref:sigma-E factor negative regulatory protein n=1 Tax=Variovorax sp. WS11 TaxID=1105204 RepID=UPI000D0CCBC3|nr:sigma-E factor negative regulatory protein [Variovorax sp. WS11]NDZ12536.1 sigma-E factor negative regulatory protein [Variovorax sp. WS11]PSL81889.1 anti-sigma factor [Variovorax sp. WS11]